MNAEPTCWCGAVVAPRMGEDGAVTGVCTGSKYHDWRDSEPTNAPRVLYISGPMSGYPECNYPAFNAAEERLLAYGYDVVNPARVEIGASYREILAEDIRQLLTCDGIATLPGFLKSKGATLEVHIGTVLQMPVKPLHEWRVIS